MSPLQKSFLTTFPKLHSPMSFFRFFPFKAHIAILFFSLFVAICIYLLICVLACWGRLPPHWNLNSLWIETIGSALACVASQKPAQTWLEDAQGKEQTVWTNERAGRGEGRGGGAARFAWPPRHRPGSSGRPSSSGPREDAPAAQAAGLLRAPAPPAPFPLPRPAPPPAGCCQLLQRLAETQCMLRRCGRRLLHVLGLSFPLLTRRALFLDPHRLMKPLVVFVLGGPGAGKGTQCIRIVEVRPEQLAGSCTWPDAGPARPSCPPSAPPRATEPRTTSPGDRRATRVAVVGGPQAHGTSGLVVQIRPLLGASGVEGECLDSLCSCAPVSLHFGTKFVLRVGSERNYGRGSASGDSPARRVKCGKVQRVTGCGIITGSRSADFG